MTTEDGSLTLYFAPGAFAGEAVVTITPISCEAAPASFLMGATCFRVSATVDGEPATELGAEMTICMLYSAGDLAAANGDPTLLRIACCDWSDGEWHPLPTMVDTAEGSVCASTNHLSDWAISVRLATHGLAWWGYVIAAVGIVAIIAVVVVLAGSRFKGRKREVEPVDVPEPEEM